jgi:hypothetical protein
MNTTKSTTKRPGDFFVAGRKRVSHWRAFEPTLTPGGNAVPWKKAFKTYFQARLSYRYLKPITTLQHGGTMVGEGLSIVAIQCSLIEFLESTLQGKSYVHGRVINPQHEYSKSGTIFEAFLVTRPPFSREFNPALTHDFYESVRCGVLHEARTKNGWTISARSRNRTIVEPNLKIVYRDNFQSALLDFVEWYKRELPARRDLQEAFLRKFNSYAHEC